MANHLQEEQCGSLKEGWWQQVHLLGDDGQSQRQFLLEEGERVSFSGGLSEVEELLQGEGGGVEVRVALQSCQHLRIQKPVEAP